jgi:NadR type nicotinamide-nucleotide adenylyltransferase
MKRVVVTGPECTGKTTLVEALAAELELPWVPEYARLFVERVGRDVESGDVEAIARGQIEAEERVAAAGAPVLLLDTDLLSTIVYSRYYFGDCPAWVEEHLAARPADLYLLAEADPVWETDRFQRATDDPRARQGPLFEEALLATGAPVVVLAGSEAERLVTARRLILAIAAAAGRAGAAPESPG